MNELDSVIETYEKVFGEQKLEIDTEEQTCAFNGIEYNVPASEVSITRSVDTENAFSTPDVFMQEYAVLRNLYEHLLSDGFSITENAPEEAPAFNAAKTITRSELQAALQGIAVLDTFRD